MSLVIFNTQAMSVTTHHRRAKCGAIHHRGLQTDCNLFLCLISVVKITAVANTTLGQEPDTIAAIEQCLVLGADPMASTTDYF